MNSSGKNTSGGTGDGPWRRQSLTLGKDDVSDPDSPRVKSKRDQLTFSAIYPPGYEERRRERLKEKYGVDINPVSVDPNA